MNPTTILRRATGVLLLISLALALLKTQGLTHVAHWSWWAVTSPVWGVWAFLVLLVALGVAWALLVALLRSSARF